MATTTPTLHRPAPAAVPPRQVRAPRQAEGRARKAVWWAACLICGGLLGVALAVAGTVRGASPSRRRMLLVVAGATVQVLLAGAFAGLAAAADSRPCPEAPGPLSGHENGMFAMGAGAYGSLGHADHSGGKAGEAEGGGVLWQATRTVVNAPVSGLALLYGATKGGEVYQCADNGTTAVVLDNGFARGGTMYGTVFLTDQHTEAATPRMRRLSEHEARHSSQWAVLSLFAGPAAMPALYTADEAFFPGGYNHFERHAGLEDGGYDPPPDSPPAAGRLAVLSIGLLAGYCLAASPALRRRAQPAPAARVSLVADDRAHDPASGPATPPAWANPPGADSTTQPRATGRSAFDRSALTRIAPHRALTSAIRSPARDTRAGHPGGPARGPHTRASPRPAVREAGTVR